MLIVVGSHSRKTGKTSVVCGIIRATPNLNWTAIKISQHGHEADGALTRDTARYLSAGAAHAFFFTREWRPKVAGANTIVESNWVLEVVQPSLYLFVTDYAIDDFKESARLYLPRAGALIVIDRPGLSPPWPFALPDVPRFPVSPPDFASPELAAMIRSSALR